MLALGCSQPAATPASSASGAPAPPGQAWLNFLDLACHEDGDHLTFSIKIANAGAETLVDSIEATTSDEVIVGDVNQQNFPSSFQSAVSLTHPVGEDGVISKLPLGAEVKIPEASTTDVWGVLSWRLPDPPPRMMAIVTATFKVRHKGEELLATPPYTFILESQPRVLEAVMSDQPRVPANDAAMLELLRSQKGQPSANVKHLIQRLEELTSKP